jgi:CHAT domain-containing protein/tetratricopeptide (TPR) repeat protein
MKSSHARLAAVLAGTLLVGVAFWGTDRIEAASLQGAVGTAVSGTEGPLKWQPHAPQLAPGRMMLAGRVIIEQKRRTEPLQSTPSRTYHPESSSGGHPKSGPGIIFKPSIILGPGHRRHYYDIREEPSRIPDVPDYDDDDTDEEEKPKPKKKAAPPRESEPKPKQAVVQAPLKQPEDKGGSVHARRFFMTHAIGFPLEMAMKVWADPLNSEKNALDALNQARKGRNRHAELSALRELASVYYWLGLFPQAAQNLQAALALSGDIFPEESDSVMLGIGGLSCAAGDYDKAVDSFDEVLMSAERSGSKEAAATAHFGKAMVSKKKDRLYDALHELKLAADTAPDAKSRARALSETGDTFVLLKEFQLAEDNLTKAREEAQKARDVEREQEIQIRLAELYAAWGKPEEARSQLLPALRNAQKPGGMGKFAQKLLAGVYMDSGQLHKAESWAEASAEPSCLGRLELLRGDYKKAVVHYQQLAKTAQKSEQLEDVFVAYTGLGKVAEATGDNNQAAQHYTKAMEAADKMREERLLSERTCFFGVSCEGFKPSEAAKGLTRVQLMTKGKAAAVLPSELIRARCFADKIVLAAQPPAAGVPIHVLEKEKTLMERLASLQQRKAILIREAHPDRYAKIVQEIKAAEKDLKDFMATVESKYKHYAAIRYPKPVDVSQAALVPDEHVLFLDALGLGVGVRLIQGNKVVAATYVPWNEADMNRDIKSFLSQFSMIKTEDGNRVKGFDADKAKGIYDKLLAGALASVPAGTRLTIIPDGALALIPFEALVVGGQANSREERWGNRPEGLQFLGDKYPISYYSSLTVMTFSRRLGRESQSGDRSLVIADPVFDLRDQRAQQAGQTVTAGKDKEFYVSLMASMEDVDNVRFKRLPETANLISGLQDLQPEHCDALTGLDATKACFLETYAPKLDRYRWVVFGTHGILSDQVPGIREPSLVLSRVPPGTDGFLKMSDIVGLKVDADVVALTACQTGTGALLTGEGVQGMGRAFQYAGAKSVLMSLWSVAERASVQLTENVFKHVRSGKSKREALRLARSELREGGYDHPFFWAAFVFVGEVD